MPARRVLFLDDNAMNVAGAAAAGFQAARVTGVGEARQRLVEAGVLSGVAQPAHTLIEADLGGTVQAADERLAASGSRGPCCRQRPLMLRAQDSWCWRARP